MSTRPAVKPRVAAVIVGTNDRQWLEECLSTLHASSLGSFIVYVDNGSSDGSAEYVERCFPEITVIRNGRDLGYGEANNVGIRSAIELAVDYVFLLNPDTRTPPDLLGSLVRFLDDNPSYGVIGPLQRVYGDTSDPPALNQWSKHALENGERHAFHHWINLPSEAGPQVGRAPNTLEHAYVQGAALMIRASLLARIGLFDPTYHTYYDEVDLCRRVRWIGFRVALICNLLVEHKGGGGGASYYRDYQMRRNKYYYLFVDPTIPFRSQVTLAGKWLFFELFTESRRLTARRDVVAQVFRVLWWLLMNGRHIVRKKREYRALYVRSRRELI